MKEMTWSVHRSLSFLISPSPSSSLSLSVNSFRVTPPCVSGRADRCNISVTGQLLLTLTRASSLSISYRRPPSAAPSERDWGVRRSLGD